MGRPLASSLPPRRPERRWRGQVPVSRAFDPFSSVGAEALTAKEAGLVVFVFPGAALDAFPARRDAQHPRRGLFFRFRVLGGPGKFRQALCEASSPDALWQDVGCSAPFAGPFGAIPPKCPDSRLEAHGLWRRAEDRAKFCHEMRQVK